MLGSLGNEEKLDNPRAKLIDMLIPIVVLIVFCIIGMMFVGGFWDPEAEGYGDLAGVWQYRCVGRPCHGAPSSRSSSPSSICCADASSASAMRLSALSMASGRWSRRCSSSPSRSPSSSRRPHSGADVFVAGLMEGAAAGLYSMLPAIIFLVALGLAFATGTSWGTFGILTRSSCRFRVPARAAHHWHFRLLWAVRSAGDHCSPISDTTIMASAGANVNHIVHVQTQLPYVLTVAVVSFVCFVIAGFVQNWVICLVIGIVLVVAAAPRLAARPSASASRNETVARSNCLIARVRGRLA